MKIILKIFIIFILLLLTINVSAFSFSELLGGVSQGVEVDCGGEDCNIQSGIGIVKDTVNGIETERTFFEYVQDITVYLLSFVSIIAVIYIIYAGFRILVGVGDEDTLKKQKMTILYVVIGILLMWLAYPIVKFIMNVLASEPV